jgi:hypothetical protein
MESDRFVRVVDERCRVERPRVAHVGEIAPFGEINLVSSGPESRAGARIEREPFHGFAALERFVRRPGNRVLMEPRDELAVQNPGER